MTDLISREAAYETLTAYYHHRTSIQHEALKEALSRVPSIDPVKHGKWVSDGYTWRCSECGKTYWGRLAKPWNYCPNCGAKVKEEKGEI